MYLKLYSKQADVTLAFNFGGETSQRKVDLEETDGLWCFRHFTRLRMVLLGLEQDERHWKLDRKLFAIESTARGQETPEHSRDI